MFEIICLLAKYLINHSTDFIQAVMKYLLNVPLKNKLLLKLSQFYMAATANISSDNFADIKLKSGVILAETGLPHKFGVLTNCTISLFKVLL